MTGPARLHLRIGNDLAFLAQVRDLVAQGVREGGFPTPFLNRLQIAVDEAVTNIVEHGYADHPRGSASIELDVEADHEQFRIEITDSGSSFDPEAVTDIDIQLHAASGRSGGLGVFLMRRIMDVVDYHYETGSPNRLVLVKYAD